MTAKPHMTAADGLMTAARQAKQRAKLCPWPDCKCETVAPGKVVCAITGDTIHFMFRETRSKDAADEIARLRELLNKTSARNRTLARTLRRATNRKVQR